MLYLALSTAPRMVPTGEVIVIRGEEIRWHKVTAWREMGLVEAPNAHAALQQAKRRFGGSPVIADFGGGSIH